jgi:hypothetical protein
MKLHAMKQSLNSKTKLERIFAKNNKNFHFSHESNKENSPRNNKKSPEEISADTIASENTAQRARGELRVLEQERSKLEKQHKSQLKEFDTSKKDARRLLEVCC